MQPDSVQPQPDNSPNPDSSPPQQADPPSAPAQVPTPLAGNSYTQTPNSFEPPVNKPKISLVWAIVALVAAIFSVVFFVLGYVATAIGVVGLILASVSRKRKALAITAIVISFIGIGLSTSFASFLHSTPNTIDGPSANVTNSSSINTDCFSANLPSDIVPKVAESSSGCLATGLTTYKGVPEVTFGYSLMLQCSTASNSFNNLNSLIKANKSNIALDVESPTLGLDTSKPFSLDGAPAYSGTEIGTDKTTNNLAELVAYSNKGYSIAGKSNCRGLVFAVVTKNNPNTIIDSLKSSFIWK